MRLWKVYIVLAASGLLGYQQLPEPVRSCAPTNKKESERATKAKMRMTDLPVRCCMVGRESESPKHPARFDRNLHVAEYTDA